MTNESCIRKEFGTEYFVGSGLVLNHFEVTVIEGFLDTEGSSSESLVEFFLLFVDVLMDEVFLVLMMVGKVFNEQFGLFRRILVYSIELLFEIQSFLIGLLADQTIIDLIPAE